MPPGGGGVTLNVTAGAGCVWSATTTSSFLSITAGSNGSGNGTVIVNADANGGRDSRTGILSVAGKTVFLYQNGLCAFRISTQQITAPADGGTVSVTLSGGLSTCVWTAAVNGSAAGYTSITPASGSGNGTITATLPANPGVTRYLSLTIAGIYVYITQPTQCPWSLTPSYFSMPAAGGPISIGISTTNASCGWSATSSQTFLTFTSPATGTGSGTLTANVAANMGLSRSATVSIGGESVHINQAQGENCVTGFSWYHGQFFDRDGGTGTANLFAGSDCAWTITGGGGAVTVLSGASGSGSATVTYSVAPNPGGTRTLTLVAGGKAMKILQSGQPPSDGTFVSYKSQAGDWPGGGGAHMYALNDAIWSVRVNTNTWNAVGVNSVNIWIDDPPGADPAWWWGIDFAAPAGQQLVPGTYESATRFPFQEANSPGFDFGGSGRGCNTLTARFVVHEAVYGPGPTVERFRATFEQHCDGRSPALTGEVRIIANPWK